MNTGNLNVNNLEIDEDSGKFLDNYLEHGPYFTTTTETNNTGQVLTTFSANLINRNKRIKSKDGSLSIGH